LLGEPSCWWEETVICIESASKIKKKGPRHSSSG
jgi:hypothetical protein